MPLDPESLYMQLGRLLQTVPEISDDTTFTPEIHLWLGRACALVAETQDLADTAAIKHAANLLTRSGRRSRMEYIVLIVYRAMAKAEILAPASAQGAFILAGNAFDAMAAVAKVVGAASTDVLIVDPYMDHKAVTDFAVLVTAAVPIRMLADAQSVKPSLKPVVSSWVAQHGSTWPLEARLAPARTLHDRLIIVDHSTAWVLTQSPQCIRCSCAGLDCAF